MTRNDPSVDAGDTATTATCPYCGSANTEREHPKGPSLCRSMFFCHGCNQPFESFR